MQQQADFGDTPAQQLLSEWDTDANLQLGLTPATVTLGSSLQCWWLCAGCAKCGARHSWQATVKDRLRSREAPFQFCAVLLLMCWAETRDMQATAAHTVLGNSRVLAAAWRSHTLMWHCSGAMSGTLG